MVNIPDEQATKQFNTVEMKGCNWILQTFQYEEKTIHVS